MLGTLVSRDALVATACYVWFAPEFDGKFKNLLRQKCRLQVGYCHSYDGVMSFGFFGCFVFFVSLADEVWGHLLIRVSDGQGRNYRHLFSV